MSWGLSLLHGTERQICWIDMLSVLDRKERIGICYELRPLFITRNGSGNLLNTCTISQGLFMFWTERNVLFKRCKELYYTDRNRNATERNGTGILFNRLGMSWGLSLLHGPEREICWIDMLLGKGSLCSKQKGTDREICSKDMLWIRVCLFITRNGMWNLFNRYVISWGLFITRSGTGNLLNRYAIRQVLFIF